MNLRQSLPHLPPLAALSLDLLDGLHHQKNLIPDLDDVNDQRREDSGTLGKNLQPGYFVLELVQGECAFAQLHTDRVSFIGQDGGRV
jgi:hypothetical protein